MNYKLIQLSFGDGYAGSAKMAILSSKVLLEKGQDVILFVSKNSLTEKRAIEKGINTIALDNNKKLSMLTNEVLFSIKDFNPNFVITYHSLDRKIGIRLKRKLKNELKSIAYRQNMSKSLPIIGSVIYNKYYDYMIACSDGVANNLISSGIKRNKVKVIHNITEYPTNIDSIQGKEIRTSFGIGDKIVLGVSSWFHKERKGFDILFDAVGKTDERFVLMIIGIPVENQNEVYEYAQTFNITKEKIIMPGFVDDIYKYYKAFDIFLLPSRSEGFSLALLEAAASELPIVASNIPGNNEFIINNINGLLFDISNPWELFNAIKYLTENKNTASQFALKAKKKALEEYNMANYGDNLNNFLTEVLNEN